MIAEVRRWPHQFMLDGRACDSACAYLNGRLCASVISCMSSYVSISLNAKATAELELRKAFTESRVQHTNTNAALQKLQHKMEAGK